MTNSTITDAQRQTQELLTQLHNADFITDGQYSIVRPMLLSRADLRFNTAHHLFSWLVEQGLVDDRADRQAVQAEIEQSVERIEQEERQRRGGIRQARPHNRQIQTKGYETPFYVKFLIGITITFFSLIAVAIVITLVSPS
ncbi:hypothetical protein [Leminorella grimontii]|uniref:hypothetical protein n=1 Tax=Leminorella grimontii TaxID=82981 RepID=UPI00208B1599|nr:hypothetical protein [Leminorella grimontii]GKX59681.1 hypothetical protein SOASR031_19960 [Leminorella grimontii]